MTDDLSASRNRVKQLKDAVDAVDDFISRHCRNADESLQITMEGITKASAHIRKAISGELWSDSRTDRRLTEVRRLVESVGGKLLEVDTENSGSAVTVLDKIEKVIRPVMSSSVMQSPRRETKDGHDLYLWHVPGDYDDNSDWRVIYTLPIPEEKFEEIASRRHKELEDELSVAVVMCS